jgi:hypothetical protein
MLFNQECTRTRRENLNEESIPLDASSINKRGSVDDFLQEQARYRDKGKALALDEAYEPRLLGEDGQPRKKEVVLTDRQPGLLGGGMCFSRSQERASRPTETPSVSAPAPGEELTVVQTGPGGLMTMNERQAYFAAARLARRLGRHEIPSVSAPAPGEELTVVQTGPGGLMTMNERRAYFAAARLARRLGRPEWASRPTEIPSVSAPAQFTTPQVQEALHPQDWRQYEQNSFAPSGALNYPSRPGPYVLIEGPENKKFIGIPEY